MAETPRPPGVPPLTPVNTSNPLAPSAPVPVSPSTTISPRLVPTKPKPVAPTGARLPNRIVSPTGERGIQGETPAERRAYLLKAWRGELEPEPDPAAYDPAVSSQVWENLKEFGRVMKAAPAGFINLVYGLPKDLLEGVTEAAAELTPGWDYKASPDTLDELVMSLGRTWNFPNRFPEYVQNLKMGRPITGMLIEDAGNIYPGGKLLKGVGTSMYVSGGAKMAAEGATAAQLARGAKTQATGQRLATTGQKIIKGSDFIGALPFKPYAWAIKRTGKLASQGMYSSSLEVGWGEKAAEAYRQQIENLIKEEPDIAFDDPRLDQLRKKAANANRLSVSSAARALIRRAVRNKEYEASIVKRTLLNEQKNPAFAGEADPVTGETYADTLTPEENQAVIAVMNGRAQLILKMSEALEMTPEDLSYMGRHDFEPGKALTPQGASLAVRFVKGELSPMQYERLAKATEAVSREVVNFTQRALNGEGRVMPLRSDYMFPEPLLDALRDRAARSGNPDVIDMVATFEEFFGAMDLDDFQRRAAMQELVEMLPEEIAMDPSIYPAKERENVEFMNRVRRSLQRRLDEEIGGGPEGPMGGKPPVGPDGRPLTPKSGRLGYTEGKLKGAKKGIDSARRKIEKILMQIEKLDEIAKKADEKIKINKAVRLFIEGKGEKQIAREARLPLSMVRDIIKKHNVIKLYQQVQQAEARVSALAAEIAREFGTTDLGELTLRQQELQDAYAAVKAESDRLQAELAAALDMVAAADAAANGELAALADEAVKLDDEMMDAEMEYEEAGGDPTDITDPSIDVTAPASQPLNGFLEEYARFLADPSEVTLFEYIIDLVDDAEFRISEGLNAEAPLADIAYAMQEDFANAIDQVQIEAARALIRRVEYLKTGADTAPAPRLQPMGDAARTMLEKERDGLLKSIEELETTKSAIKETPEPSPAAAPEITEDTFYEAIRPSKNISSSLFSGFIRLFDEYRKKYVLPTAKKAIKNLTSELNAALKDKDSAGVFVHDTKKGVRWIGSQYVFVKTTREGVELFKDKESGAYITNKGEKTIVRRSDGVDLEKLATNFAKDATKKITIRYKIGNIVVATLEDGSTIFLAHDYLSLFEDGTEFFGSEPNKPAVAKKGKEIVGAIMPVRLSDIDFGDTLPTESQIIDAITLYPVTFLDRAVSKKAVNDLTGPIRRALGFGPRFGTSESAPRVTYLKPQERIADIDSKLTGVRRRLKNIEDELAQDDQARLAPVPAPEAAAPRKIEPSTFFPKLGKALQDRTFGNGTIGTVRDPNGIFISFRISANKAKLYLNSADFKITIQEGASIQDIYEVLDQIESDLPGLIDEYAAEKDSGMGIPLSSANELVRGRYGVSRAGGKKFVNRADVEAAIAAVRKAIDEIAGEQRLAPAPEAAARPTMSPELRAKFEKYISAEEEYKAAVWAVSAFIEGKKLEALSPEQRAELEVLLDRKDIANQALEEAQEFWVDEEYVQLADTLGFDEAFDYLSELRQSRLAPVRNVAEVTARAEAITPDPAIPPGPREAVYSQELLDALAEDASRALRAAETMDSRMKALDDYLAAAKPYQELYQRLQSRLASMDKFAAKQSAREERLRKLRQEALPKQQKKLREMQRVEGAIELSSTYAKLKNLSSMRPLSIVREMEGTYPGEETPYQMLVAGDDGMTGTEMYSPGPMYVPTGAFESRRGRPRTEVTRPGLSGWKRLTSERYRSGDRQTIFDIRDVALRMGQDIAQMSMNEAWRAIVQQFSETAEKILGQETLDALWREANDKALSLTPEQMEAMGLQAATELGEYLDGVDPEGIAAYAEGVPSPGRAFQYAVRKIYGAAVADAMYLRGYEPVNPYASIDAGVAVSAIDNSGIPDSTYSTPFLPTYLKESVGQMELYFDPGSVNRIWRGATRVTSAMKTSTLVLSAMWQIGDLVTSIIIAQMTGVDVPDMLRRMKQVAREEYGGFGRTMWNPNTPLPAPSPVTRLAQEAPVQDLSLAMSERAEILGRKIAEPPPVGPIRGGIRTFVQGSFKVNETINRISRHAYFLELLHRELRKRPQYANLSPDDALAAIASDGSWKIDPEMRDLFFEVAETANKWLGDFANLSVWERKSLTPFIPFYSWTKHIHHVFYALSLEHPQSIRWYATIGSLAYDADEDPMDLRRGGMELFGGIASTNIFNPLGDVIDGPLIGFLTTGDGRSLGSTLGPVPRTIGAVAGLDLASMNRLQRAPGYGAYSESGRQISGSILPIPGTGTGPSQTLGFTLQQFPLATRALNILPRGNIPFTSIATGPTYRYATGEARTRPGSRVRLEPPGGQLAAVGRLFGVPGIPWRSIEQEEDIMRSAKARLQTIEVLRRRRELLGPP